MPTLLTSENIEGVQLEEQAAALATPAEERGKSVCILSGGNIDASRLAEILQ